MLAGPQAELVRLMAAIEDRVACAFQHGHAQLPINELDLGVPPRDPLVPRRGPGPRLPPHDIRRARLQLAPPTLLRLRTLGDEFGHTLICAAGPRWSSGCAAGSIRGPASRGGSTSR